MAALVMRKKSIAMLVVYALVMVALIVGVDLTVFRNFMLARLLANVGIDPALFRIFMLARLLANVALRCSSARSTSGSCDRDLLVRP